MRERCEVVVGVDKWGGAVVEGDREIGVMAGGGGEGDVWVTGSVEGEGWEGDSGSVVDAEFGAVTVLHVITCGEQRILEEGNMESVDAEAMVVDDDVDGTFAVDGEVGGSVAEEDGCAARVGGEGNVGVKKVFVGCHVHGGAAVDDERGMRMGGALGCCGVAGCELEGG